jgi:hypothetical protein
MFMDFFNEHRFISRDIMNHKPTQEKSKIEEEASKSPQYQIQSTQPEMSIIKVEQTQTNDGVKVILHRVEFAVEWIAAPGEPARVSWPSSLALNNV